MDLPFELNVLQERLLSKETTVSEIVDQCISNALEHKHLNAYIELFEKEARTTAKRIDDRLAQNPQELGKLFGLVVSIKDVICYQDHQVSASSKILKGYTSPFHSTAVERLIKEDAIIIGRTNCDEFGMGSANENSIYGPTLNQKGGGRIPGGSSGGSAVSVQIGSCHVALGSDTGGSIRQPASHCGLIGLKPGYGRISRFGLLAYASSFDQIGLIGNHVKDVKKVLNVISGFDEKDATSSSIPMISKNEKVKFNLGVIQSFLNHEGLQESIRTGINHAIKNLDEETFKVSMCDLDLLDVLVPIYYILTTAEASSNLSRYDGVRYGYRTHNSSNLNDTITKSRTEAFGIEVKRRIMLGTYVLSEGYYDAYYTKAQKIRRMLKNQVDQLLKRYDVLVFPVAPSVARVSGGNSSPVDEYLSDIYTVVANLTGLPAISIPCGFDENQMPFGLQLMSGSGEEPLLLDISDTILRSLQR